MNKKTMEKINKLAVDITGYDIPDIENYKTPREAIEYHLCWLVDHDIDIRRGFEDATRKYITD